VKRIFSETEKEKIIKSQLNLLKKDLKDCLTLLKTESYRGAYIFLFDALERIFDIFFARRGEKPTSRIEREELIFRYFSPETYRNFKSFYYERRGGMYEDFLFISKKDFSDLFKFFKKTLSEIQIREINNEIEKLIKEIENIS